MESPRILSEGQLKYTSPRSSWISDITGCPVMSTGAAHIPPSRPLRLSLFDISPYSSHDFRIRKLFTCCLYVIIYIYISIHSPRSRAWHNGSARRRVPSWRIRVSSTWSTFGWVSWLDNPALLDLQPEHPDRMVLVCEVCLFCLLCDTLLVHFGLEISILCVVFCVLFCLFVFPKDLRVLFGSKATQLQCLRCILFISPNLSPIGGSGSSRCCWRCPPLGCCFVSNLYIVFLGG